jgi:hypothetical protein
VKRLLRATSLIALTAVSFATVAWGLHRLVPLPETNGLRAKFAAWSENRNDYEILYLGSSQTFRGIQPAVIDERLSIPERPIRSFNFGVPGMFSYETDALLARILEAAPERKLWILIEVPLWRPISADGFFSDTLRNASWHTPTQTWNALQSLALAADRGIADRVGIAWAQINGLGLWAGNVGRGSEIVAATLLPTSDAQLGLVDDLLRRQGYKALEEENIFFTRRRRNDFVANGDAWVLRRKRARFSVSEREIEQYNYDALIRQVARVESSNHRLVYVSLPQSKNRRMDGLLLEHELIPDLIDLNRPDLHPGLFTTESHYDTEHMSQSGARRMSEILADELGRRMRADDEAAGR